MQALREAEVSRTVYRVNIDAVIAALLLKLTWTPWRTGAIGVAALEATVFTLFVYARMLGCAADIDDHLERGRDLETCTPSQVPCPALPIARGGRNNVTVRDSAAALSWFNVGQWDTHSHRGGDHDVFGDQREVHLL